MMHSVHTYTLLTCTRPVCLPRTVPGRCRSVPSGCCRLAWLAEWGPRWAPWSGVCVCGGGGWRGTCEAVDLMCDTNERAARYYYIAATGQMRPQRTTGDMYVCKWRMWRRDGVVGGGGSADSISGRNTRCPHRRCRRARRRCRQRRRRASAAALYSMSAHVMHTPPRECARSL